MRGVGNLIERNKMIHCQEPLCEAQAHFRLLLPIGVHRSYCTPHLAGKVPVGEIVALTPADHDSEVRSLREQKYTLAQPQKLFVLRFNLMDKAAVDKYLYDNKINYRASRHDVCGDSEGCYRVKLAFGEWDLAKDQTIFALEEVK